jgi:hypothetical protein
MVNFVKGLELSRGYYHDLIKPLLNKQYPALKYTAGLIGYGSDVLGYDTEISRDHMWGPRLYLFLSKKDLSEKQSDIMDFFSHELPTEYRGYPTHFSNPDGSGIRRMEAPSQGTVSPLIFLNTPEEMYQEYLGISHSKPLTDSDWLTMGEHRLLAFTAGELFHDELEMEKLRERVSAYPLNIRLYLMASLWEMISQKEAFVGRCGDLGDDMGSRLNATSIVHYLMRLAFLWDNRYAPYGKWFATAFEELSSAEKLGPLLKGALAASEWQKREDFLCRAYVLAGECHNSLGLTENVSPDISDYYGRPYRVIFGGRYSEALTAKITDPILKEKDKIGSVSHFSDVCQLYDNPVLTQKMKSLYEED